MYLRDKLKKKEYDQEYRFVLYNKRHGINKNDYIKLLNEQDSKCAICSGQNPSGRRLHLDHCHITGKVRGLLCSCCNTSLGKLRDSPKLLQNAINYLNKHDAHKTSDKPL